MGFGLDDEWLAAVPTAGELRELALALLVLAAVAPTVGTETMVKVGAVNRAEECVVVPWRGACGADRRMLCGRGRRRVHAGCEAVVVKGPRAWQRIGMWEEPPVVVGTPSTKVVNGFVRVM